MNPRRYIVVAVMTIALGLYCDLRSESSKASAAILIVPSLSVTVGPDERPAAAHRPDAAQSSEPWLELLGASSEEAIYDALYNGRSLADIAEANGRDVQPIIDRQIDELGLQLSERLAAGSITPETYLAQLSELEDIVSRSAHGTA